MHLESILVSPFGIGKMIFREMRNATGHQRENRRQQDQNNYYDADDLRSVVLMYETLREKLPLHLKHCLILRLVFCQFWVFFLYICSEEKADGCSNLKVGFTWPADWPARSPSGH